MPLNDKMPQCKDVIFAGRRTVEWRRKFILSEGNMARATIYDPARSTTLPCRKTQHVAVGRTIARQLLHGQRNTFGNISVGEAGDISRGKACIGVCK